MHLSTKFVGFLLNIHISSVEFQQIQWLSFVSEYHSFAVRVLWSSRTEKLSIIFLSLMAEGGAWGLVSIGNVWLGPVSSMAISLLLHRSRNTLSSALLLQDKASLILLKLLIKDNLLWMELELLLSGFLF